MIVMLGILWLLQMIDSGAIIISHNSILVEG